MTRSEDVYKHSFGYLGYSWGTIRSSYVALASLVSRLVSLCFSLALSSSLSLSLSLSFLFYVSPSPPGDMAPLVQDGNIKPLKYENSETN